MLSSRFYQNPCFASDAVSLATSLLYSIIAKIIKNDTFEDFRDSGLWIRYSADSTPRHSSFLDVTYSPARVYIQEVIDFKM